nr:retrotransposon protein, putative, Ty1-copia subclass [Tanacetum cinerariifolium]
MKVEDDEVGDLEEHANYKTVMLDPNKVIWQCAMDEEMKSMKVNKVWIVVDRLPNANVVRNKWPYKKKTDMDGKQASHQWNKQFDEEIKRFGFIQNRDEPCVYRKASGSDVVFLILYVDDILIMGNNIPRLKEVKDYLGKCFSVKDLGEAAYILRITIYRDRSLRLIGLNQSAYIDKILKKFNMQNSKKGFIPMEVKHDLSNEMCASSDEEKAYMKKVPYASAVGSIMYAV